MANELNKAKMRKIVEMRNAGYTWEYIANGVGYKTRSGVYNFYKRNELLRIKTEREYTITEEQMLIKISRTEFFAVCKELESKPEENKEVLAIIKSWFFRDQNHYGIKIETQEL